jgi:hypothetical protein
MIGAHDWKGPATYQTGTARQLTALRRLARTLWNPADIAPRNTGWQLVEGVWRKVER